MGFIARILRMIGLDRLANRIDPPPPPSTAQSASPTGSGGTGPFRPK